MPTTTDTASDRRSLQRLPQRALVAVCILHTVSPYVLRGAHPGYGWDETVYVSQLDRHAVAAYFSAPRARGVTLLTAPVAELTTSVAAMRAWLALLSGVGLYAGLAPWLALGRRWAVPVAALLWSGLWVATYYSYLAMPNQWIAYAALGACASVFLAIRPEHRRWGLVGLGGWLAFAALLRPSDSLAIAIPVGAVAVWRSPRWRPRLVATAAVVGGLAAGWLEWLIEAYVRFGGPVSRLHAASVENGGVGLHWELGAELRSVAGPLLCRYHCGASAPAGDRVWWLALPLLVIAGLLVGRRHGTAGMDGLCVVVGLALAAEYVVLVGYAAPRFLEPSYAVLALPVAELVVAAARVARSDRRRLAVAVAMVAVFGVQVVGQARIVRSLNRQNSRDSARADAISGFLKGHGVSGPCAIAGLAAGPVSFQRGCYGIDTVRWRPIAKDLARRAGEQVVVIGPRDRSPASFVDAWASYGLSPAGEPTWRAWIS